MKSKAGEATFPARTAADAIQDEVGRLQEHRAYVTEQAEFARQSVSTHEANIKNIDSLIASYEELLTRPKGA